MSKTTDKAVKGGRKMRPIQTRIARSIETVKSPRENSKRDVLLKALRKAGSKGAWDVELGVELSFKGTPVTGDTVRGWITYDIAQDMGYGITSTVEKYNGKIKEYKGTERLRIVLVEPTAAKVKKGKKKAA